MKTLRSWIPQVSLALALAASVPASATRAGEGCSATAVAAFEACRSGAQEDYLIAFGKCINLAGGETREECMDDAKDELGAAQRLCRKQRGSRFDICALLAEDRYDPDINPDLFDNDLTHLTKPNRYFPLKIGNRWEFGGSESVAIEVLNRTKLIEGVKCFVVRDVVSVDGEIHEDTEDWFAQAKNGDTYYFGEESKDYESFEGDDPRTPELITLEGSFKAGRDGDKPGIAFPGSPVKGKAYRQEFSLGNAEDIAEIVSTTYAYGANPELDRLVPRQLAQLLCAGDCVVTKEFQPLAPGVFERKFYAPGIGGFLVIHLDTGEVAQLTGCNFDPRCAALPAP